MTKFNTGNPVGSSDPRDLYDNAENMDSLINGDQAAYNDRLGKSRRSWQSVEYQVNQQASEFAADQLSRENEFNSDQSRRETEFQADQSRREGEFQGSQDDREGVFNAYLVSAGYQFAGDYAAGIEITQYNQVVRDTSGELWRASGSTELPYTTTGTGLPEGGKFVSAGDAVLRQDLGLSDGSELVGHQSGTVKSALERAEVQAGKYFEAPYQPSFNAADSDSIWDGINNTIDAFVSTMLDPLVGLHPDKVTRKVLGKDESGAYDILEYDFNPKGATQTILLTYGVNGRETVPVYSFYRFLHYLLNDPDIHPDIRYLHDNVRIKAIPSLGIWAGSQDPKVYGNFNDRNIVRNFPANWEYIGATERGPTPFSEAEAQILADWMEANSDASFYFDFHTDYSFFGQLPTRDVWNFRSEADKYLKPVVDATAKRMAQRAVDVNGISEQDLSIEIEDGAERVASGKWCFERLGIPWATIEYAETRYGGRFGGHEDIQNHLTMMVNYISDAAKAKLREKIEEDKKQSFKSFVRTFRPVEFFFSEKYNLNWGIGEIYDRLDEIAVANPGYVSVIDIGRDASDTYDLKAVELTPEFYTKTVLLYATPYATTSGAETLYLLRLIDILANQWADYGLSELRSNTRFIVIPTDNPWGFDQGYAGLESLELSFSAFAGARAKTLENSNGVVVWRNLGGAESEAVAVDSYLSAKTIDYGIMLDYYTSSSAIGAVRYIPGVTDDRLVSGYVSAAKNADSIYRLEGTSADEISLNNNALSPGDGVNALQAMGVQSPIFIRLNRGNLATSGSAYLESKPCSRNMADAHIALLLDYMVGIPD